MKQFASAALLLGWLMTLTSCATTPAPPPRLWTELQALCGQAFEGRMIEGTEPSDAAIGAQRLVMHVRSCTPDEIRIPFHAGGDRSRTWVLTRTPTGLRLKHEHRHEDGTEDRVSQYGGDAVTTSDALRADFPADELTASLVPAAATNVWTLSIEPGKSFTYALRRSNRRFRAEFDLSRPVPAPPPPW